MTLIESLPESLQKLPGVDPKHSRKLMVAIASDLTLQGSFGEEWLVVTKDRLLVYSSDSHWTQPRLGLDLSRMTNVKADSLVGGGSLLIEVDNVIHEAIRFTDARERRFSRAAKYLKDIIEIFQEATQKGQQPSDVPPPHEDETEKPRNCPQCGRPLQEGSMVCPKCFSKRKTLARLASYFKPYWMQTLIVWALMLVGTVIHLIPPGLRRPIIDKCLIPVGDSLEISDRLYRLGIYVFALAGARVLHPFVQIIRGRILAVLGAKLLHDLRTQLYRHLQLLSLRYFDSNQTGAIIARVTHDTQSLQHALLGFVPHVTAELLTFVGIFTVMLLMNWQLTLLLLIPVPFVVLLSRVFWRVLHRLWHRFLHIRQLLVAAVNDSFLGIRVVKAFAQEQQEMERFDGYSVDFYTSSAHLEKIHATFFPFLMFIMNSGFLIIWYVGGRQVIGGELTLGTLLTFVGYLSMFYAPLRFFSRAADWMARTLTAAERIFEVLDTQPDVKEADDAKLMSEIKGRVEFRHVTFGYDVHKPVLHDITMAVNPGEMIGLVGHSGAGKSTTINLICRFYDVNDGQILIDNIDIRQIKQQDLRSQIGVVLQDTFLFNGTIAENIGYAKPGANSLEVMTAAKAANAHDFIVSKPDGYDTMVGERGQLLSGGEKQRIAIARAILHNPRILILDEATSSVDTDTEQQIQEAIARLVKGRTTFAIAHRLSTLKNANRLVVLKDGRVEEIGTHDELLEKKGEFHRLVNIQKQISSIKALTR